MTLQMGQPLQNAEKIFDAVGYEADTLDYNERKTLQSLPYESQKELGTKMEHRSIKLHRVDGGKNSNGHNATENSYYPKDIINKIARASLLNADKILAGTGSGVFVPTTIDMNGAKCDFPAFSETAAIVQGALVAKGHNIGFVGDSALVDGAIGNDTIGACLEETFGKSSNILTMLPYLTRINEAIQTGKKIPGKIGETIGNLLKKFSEYLPTPSKETTKPSNTSEQKEIVKKPDRQLKPISTEGPYNKGLYSHAVQYPGLDEYKRPNTDGINRGSPENAQKAAKIYERIMNEFKDKKSTAKNPFTTLSATNSIGFATSEGQKRAPGLQYDLKGYIKELAALTDRHWFDTPGWLQPGDGQKRIPEMLNALRNTYQQTKTGKTV